MDKGITNEQQLFTMAKRLGVRLDDIFTIEEAANRIRPLGRYIMLLHRGNNVGHWVCYDRGYYFDSFGQPPPNAIKKRVKSYNQRQYQDIAQKFCGS